MAYLDKTGLTYFWSKIKAKLNDKSNVGHTHSASEVSGLSKVATSNSYNDLSNKPTIPSAYSHPSSHPASMITGLATVATSGSYNDLSNKPTIPSAYTHPSSHPASMITGLSTVATSGKYSDLSGLPTIPTVPTKLSQLSNDKEFLTKTEVQALISALETKIANEYLGGYKWQVGESNNAGKSGYVTVKKP